MPLTNDGGCLGELCLVGEKPGLGAALFKRAGPATGLEDTLFASGAGRGELCFTGERPGDGGACRCNVGLMAESGTTLPSGVGRGEVCLVGENPGDCGACCRRVGPAIGLEEGM